MSSIGVVAALRSANSVPAFWRTSSFSRMLYAAADAGDFGDLGDVGDHGASRRWRKPGEKGTPGSTLKRNHVVQFERAP